MIELLAQITFLWYENSFGFKYNWMSNTEIQRKRVMAKITVKVAWLFPLQLHTLKLSQATTFESRPGEKLLSPRRAVEAPSLNSNCLEIQFNVVWLSVVVLVNNCASIFISATIITYKSNYLNIFQIIDVRKYDSNCCVWLADCISVPVAIFAMACSKTENICCNKRISDPNG